MSAQEFQEMGPRLCRRRGYRKILILLIVAATVVFYRLIAGLQPPGYNAFEPSEVLSDTHVTNLNGTSKVLSKRGDEGIGSQTRQYCNSPFEPISGSEGYGPKGYELRMVHVFIRHGDRSSLYHVPGFQQPTLDCNFKKWYSKFGENEKFKRFATRMKIVKFKKSIGKSYLNYSLLPDDDVCKPGTLTGRGALQHLTLGQYFYERYHSHASLWSYKPALHTRSTSTKRTIQSAIAFMYGFLPEFKESFFTMNMSKDVYMCVPGSRPCGCAKIDTYNQLHKEYLHSEMRRAPSAQYKHFIENVTKRFMLTPKVVEELSHMLDAMLPAECHGKKAPCLQKHPETCWDNETMEVLWDEYLSSQRVKTVDPNKTFLKLSYLRVYPVLHEISFITPKILERPSSSRFVLYSGHDKTITALRIALGFFDGTWAPFASRLVLELYESKFRAGKLYIRILYNGKDVTRSVPVCTESYTDFVCEFELFQKFVNTQLIDLFGKTDYASACT